MKTRVILILSFTRPHAITYTNDVVAVVDAYFPFVNGRCHFSERSLPFETVDAFFSFELHSLGLRTQKVAVTGSCVSMVI